MAEYIERGATIDRLEKLFQLQAATARAIIEAIPAADVFPVVRCKDCRHRDPEDKKCDSGQTERQGCPFPVHDDYFCAYGEV